MVVDDVGPEARYQCVELEDFKRIAAAGLAPEQHHAAVGAELAQQFGVDEVVDHNEHHALGLYLLIDNVYEHCLDAAGGKAPEYMTDFHAEFVKRVTKVGIICLYGKFFDRSAAGFFDRRTIGQFWSESRKFFCPENYRAGVLTYKRRSRDVVGLRSSYLKSYLSISYHFSRGLAEGRPYCSLVKKQSKKDRCPGGDSGLDLSGS